MCRGPARGPLGWAEALSPRGPGLGFPLGFGSSFGVRVGDWPVEGEYSTSVLQVGQGVRVTLCWTWLDAAEAYGEFSRRSGRFANHPYGGGWSRLGGGCAFRRDGFLPPQERRMGGGSVGPPPARPFDPRDLQHAQGERPHLGDGFTPGHPPALGVGDGVGERGGGCGHLNGLWPDLPLDPSIPLKVSGPTLGMDSGSGAGMTVMQRAHRERCSSLGGLT